MGDFLARMFGVPSNCPRCGKRVYAAEQKLAEDKSWHAMCWSLEFKERESNKKHHKDVTSYNKQPDVQPSYYRVSDPATGAPARMEAGGERPAAAAPSSGGVEGGVNFCSGCGKKRSAADKFCSGCGKKLD